MGDKMKTVAYLSASKDRQDIRKQKLSILEFVKREQISISRFIEMPISSKTTKENKIELLLGQLSPKDTLIVSDLSRIGWSLREIVKTVDLLLKNGIRFVAIKENIDINNEKQDLRSQVMVETFGLFAEIEHQLVSQRTKEALAVAKAKGRLGGRPPALNPQQQELAIKLYKEGKLRVKEICQMMGISKPTLYSYLKKASSKLKFEPDT